MTAIYWSYSVSKEIKFFSLIVELEIPEVVITEQRYKVLGVEALCILLRRFAYPNRFCDIQYLFGKSSSALCAITQCMVDFLIGNFQEKIEYDREHLERNSDRFCQVISNKGSPLDNCFGFIDGTARPCCRPTRTQRVMFSGHKRVHCIKFQSIVTPDGIIPHMFGPIEGCRHDSGMLTISQLIQRFNNSPRLREKVIYGDPAYPINRFIITPFRTGNITVEQAEFNRLMSKVRESVEWGFGRIIGLWAYLDFSKNLKVLLSPLGLFYLVGTFLTNCHTCLNQGNQISAYFHCSPPTLQEYLSY